MGEGQYRVDGELLGALDDLDDEAVAALHRADEPELDRYLDEMWELVKVRGERLSDDDLSTSDIIVPPSDLTLEETRELMDESQGLIPDLPS
jgi:PspA-Associated protein